MKKFKIEFILGIKYIENKKRNWIFVFKKWITSYEYITNLSIFPYRTKLSCLIACRSNLVWRTCHRWLVRSASVLSDHLENWKPLCPKYIFFLITNFPVYSGRKITHWYSKKLSWINSWVNVVCDFFIVIVETSNRFALFL